MNAPLISIIIPCYNQAAFLNECLESVVNQTYSHWEAILINDGSTDNTEEICKNWVEKDSRFQYIFTENAGVSNARNLGLQKASGDFIQFLDADDKMDLQNFEKKLAKSENAQIILGEFNVLTNNQYFPGYNRLKLEYLDFKTILTGWELQFTIPIHAVLISRELLKDFAFDLTLLCFEDYLMWLHITEQKPKCIFIDEPLVSYRKELNTNSASTNLSNIVNEKIKLLPILKSKFGEKAHDEMVYQTLKTRSLQNIEIKNEFRKITSEKLISKYLQLKRWYYTLKN